MNSVNKQNAKIQHRNDEGTFINKEEKSNKKNASECLTGGLCKRVYDEVTPVAKPLRDSMNATDRERCLCL